MTPRPDTAFVAGASRGIGAELARTLAARGATVFCAARNPSAPAIETLQAEHGERIRPLAIDFEEPRSVAAAATAVAACTGRLDWIVNTVGLLHDGALQPERKLADIDAGNVMRHFAVNSVGPLLLARELAHLLPRSEPCVFASLSARVGSIGDNRLGGWYGYRGSKAAQNMFLRTLAIELARRYRRIRCVALHPGTVATDLSAPFRGGVKAERLFDVQTAVGHLMNVLEQLDDDDNGKFFAWDGQEIPW